MSKRLFRILAIVGLVTSAAVNAATILDLGVKPTMENFAFLHVGVFVVFFPALAFHPRKKASGWAISVDDPEAGAPRWMKVVGAVFAAYAGGNFLLLMASGWKPADVDVVRMFSAGGNQGQSRMALR
jgi:hypothetical protein